MAKKFSELAAPLYEDPESAAEIERYRRGAEAALGQDRPDEDASPPAE